MDFDDQSYDGGDYDSGAGSGLTRTRTRSGSGSSSGSSSRSGSSWSAGSSWVYVDPHGNHQGPHDTQAIKKWIAGGWLAPDVLVKPAGPGDEFLPIREVEVFADESNRPPPPPPSSSRSAPLAASARRGPGRPRNAVTPDFSAGQEDVDRFFGSSAAAAGSERRIDPPPAAGGGGGGTLDF
jgi:hypothetical protein